MKKIFAVSLMFLFFFAALGNAQPLYLHWTKFIGGTLGEILRDAVPTSDGGIVFTGLASSIDGDIPFTSPDTLNGLRFNLMVGKLDSNKQLSWLKIYRGQQKDHGFRVIQLNDGGYAVLGQTESSDGDVTWNRGSDDIWLLRLDANGDLLWQKTFGSSYSDQAISIAQTSDNNFIILGHSNGFDHDVPFHYGTSQFDLDLLLLKVNGSGDLIWSKTVGGYGDEGLSGSIFEANGGYYFAGYSNSRDNDCSDTSWCPNVNTGYNAYLFFADTSGIIQWSKSYGGSDWDGIENAFWDERDSTVVMVGLTQSHDFMITQNYPSITSTWLLKTDKNGAIIWQTILGDSLANNYWPDIMPINGGYLVSCSVGDNQQLGHIGNNDVLTIVVDTMGSILSGKLIGGVKFDIVKAIVPYKQGYAVLGYSGSQDFVEGVNDNVNHNSNFQSDAFISYFANTPLSIKLFPVKASIKVYPNPAKDNVRIELPANDVKGMLTFMDAHGRTVHKESVKGQRIVDINISGWAKGSYIVQWKGKNTATTTAQKLVIAE